MRAALYFLPNLVQDIHNGYNTGFQDKTENKSIEYRVKAIGVGALTLLAVNYLPFPDFYSLFEGITALGGGMLTASYLEAGIRLKAISSNIALRLELFDTKTN